jgi:hypothetical protein
MARRHEASSSAEERDKSSKRLRDRAGVIIGAAAMVVTGAVAARGLFDPSSKPDRTPSEQGARMELQTPESAAADHRLMSASVDDLASRLLTLADLSEKNRDAYPGISNIERKTYNNSVDEVSITLPAISVEGNADKGVNCGFVVTKQREVVLSVMAACEAASVDDQGVYSAVYDQFPLGVSLRYDHNLVGNYGMWAGGVGKFVENPSGKGPLHGFESLAGLEKHGAIGDAALGILVNDVVYAEINKATMHGTSETKFGSDSLKAIERKLQKEAATGNLKRPIPADFI